jgi:[amino group carrier protein]-L-2-aminoadipate 6-kinase
MNELIIVVKIGGIEGLDYGSICQDAAELISQGNQLILVHGGSADANALGVALNWPPRFIQSPSGFTSRYTDPRTLEIFTMAVNGRLNTTLVAQLQSLGVNAVGLSGADGRLMLAERKEAIQSIENGKRKIIRDDYSGKIIEVNRRLLRSLLSLGLTPVIAPLAISHSGEILNVDADRAAAGIAAAIGSASLILLTAAPGLLKAFPDESSLVHHLPRARLNDAMDWAAGRMKKKVLGAQEALQGGVGQVIIADGRVKGAIQTALNGSGTIIA